MCLMILSYILLTWPAIVILNRPAPLILGLPLIIFWIHLMLMLTVGTMLLLYRWEES